MIQYHAELGYRNSVSDYLQILYIHKSYITEFLAQIIVFSHIFEEIYTYYIPLTTTELCFTCFNSLYLTDASKYLEIRRVGAEFYKGLMGQNFKSFVFIRYIFVYPLIFFSKQTFIVFFIFVLIPKVFFI